MIALIEEYRTELSAVCAFSEDTVQTYVSCVVSFSEYVKAHFDISVGHVQGDHICQWMTALKQTGLSGRRHKYDGIRLPTHSVLLRCSSVEYCEYSPSSCLA